MKKKRFNPQGFYRYVIHDPGSKLPTQINERVDGNHYAAVYRMGYLSSYGVIGMGVDIARQEVPQVSTEFVRSIWDEGMKDGAADKMGGVPPPPDGIRPFLKE